MSPVFRHGRLRLYLLKLLDEAPRHGYEVIRLLQDRFMGIYAPSPGTIYPRLARLEEEGLVTHDEADGRKVYRITEKGREELRARLDDLAELEEEITASVRDIAREVTEDVRDTVRTLREELSLAARDFPAREAGGKEQAARGRADAKQATEEARRAAEEARRAAEEAQRAAEAERPAERPAPEDAPHEEQQAGSGAPRDAKHDRDCPGRDWHEEARDWSGRRRGEREWGEWAGWTGWGGWPGAARQHGWADPDAYRDLERLAKQFSRELRSAAWHAQAVSEDALRDLRGILDETIDRIKAEVFKGKTAPGDPEGSTPPAD